MPTNIPRNIDKYFYNRKDDIKRIKLQINSIYEDLPNQILLTGKRGIGKTFLLKKILNDENDDILTIYIDISKIYGNNQKIAEEEILKKILTEINEELSKRGKLKKIKAQLDKIVQKMTLKNYDINDSVDIFNIPLPKIKDNYPKLSEFVMELPQHIVDSSKIFLE